MFQCLFKIPKCVYVFNFFSRFPVVLAPIFHREHHSISHDYAWNHLDGQLGDGILGLHVVGLFEQLPEPGDIQFH